MGNRQAYSRNLSRRQQQITGKKKPANAKPAKANPLTKFYDDYKAALIAAALITKLRNRERNTISVAARC